MTERTASTSGDLHRGFAAPDGAATGSLITFLRKVDELPGVRTIHRAMRKAGSVAAARSLLDVGCGAGIETRRIAEDHPDLRVIGCDQNPAMLAEAARFPLPNASWVESDLAELAGNVDPVDVVRTERVLMYVRDLAEAIGALWRLVAPGGRLVCFELDYGATILRPCGFDPEFVGRLVGAMCDALPQPFAGRQLPVLAAEHGAEVTAEPYAFAVTHDVWQRIVAATLLDAVRDGRLPGEQTHSWLAAHEQLPHDGFHAAFTGILTTATRVPS